MLQHIKRLTKHSAVYGIGHIISRFIGFLLLPIHTNVLLPEEYRTPALLFSSLAILNVIFSYGMDVAFLRFFILGESKEEKRRIFSTAFWMIMATGTCFMTFMLFNPIPFSRLIFRSDEYAILIRLASGILLADTLGLIPFLTLRGEEKSVRFVVLKSLNIVVNVSLNILLVVILRWGVKGIFIANLVASVFTLFTLLPIIVRWIRLRFDRETLLDLFRFGLPYIPSGLAVIIMDQIGRFFLDRMMGEEPTGIFSAGYKLGMFMALVVAAFRFAWHPFFLSTSKQEDAPKIFARVLTYFLVVTGFFFLVISYFIEEIVRFRIAGIGLVGEEYAAGIQIVPLIMLAYIGYGVYANFVVGIYLKKKTIYLPFITGTGALVNVVANIFLIPRLGIMGAAWSTLLAYASMAFTLYWVSRKLYFIPYELVRILKLILFFGIFFFLGTGPFFGGSYIFRILLLAALFPMFWIVRFFYPDEKSALKRFLRVS